MTSTDWVWTFLLQPHVSSGKQRASKAKTISNSIHLAFLHFTPPTKGFTMNTRMRFDWTVSSWTKDSLCFDTERNYSLLYLYPWLCHKPIFCNLFQVPGIVINTQVPVDQVNQQDKKKRSKNIYLWKLHLYWLFTKKVKSLLVFWNSYQNQTRLCSFSGIDLIIILYDWKYYHLTTVRNCMHLSFLLTKICYY